MTSETAIPLIEAGTEGPLAVLTAAPERLQTIIGMAKRHYGGMALKVADAASRRWMEKTGNPYLAEIDAVAEAIRTPGAHMLNLSFEWSCTAGIGPAPDGSGNRMLRTLDWPLAGLGRTVIVSRHDSPVGEYFNISWPGFAGITTAMAPGRFSAALNQPPMRWTSPVMAFDWLANRVGVWKSDGLPPTHLLRKVFDECATYEDAKRMLCETPVCIPVFYSLSGLEPEQGCAIERTESRAEVREGPVSTANHWICIQVPGRARGANSRGRWAVMEEKRDQAADDFSWVVPPIFNPTTRMSVIANAKARKLMVQGWEEEGPVTPVFEL
ncbi:MAG: hypothetical protein MI741_19500 [Rhodospirillales bacterium]|nr:hypothetical protein [Rhodospirillales bacterium]